MTRTQAFVNMGRWIADCPRQHCTNAEKLNLGQTTLRCSNCLQVATVEWPKDVVEITAVLERRPVPQTRNWAPAGHWQAVATQFPDGQTARDLADENRQFGVE